MISLPRVILLAIMAALVAACSDEGRGDFTRVPVSVTDDEEVPAAVVASRAPAKQARDTADTGYVPVPAIYKSVDWTHGDGSDPRGGIPAARTKEPPVIPSNFDVTPWLISPTLPGPPDGEAKFRTHCNFSHVAYDDPIVFPGQPGASHLHMFFGNTLTNAYSTYESLRTTGGSTCGGGPINRSAYWFPAVLKDNALGDGTTKVIKPDFAIVYYKVWQGREQGVKRLFRGLSYVFGFNPADPNNEFEKAEIAASRDAAYREDPGGAHSYKFFRNGFNGWKCELTNGSNEYSPIPGGFLQPYLRTADGRATLTCPPSERIAASLSGPPCWDGTNLTSPDGRKHFRQFVQESTTGKGICPEGWYEVPVFDLIIWFSHEGPDDYKEWYLSSDRMPSMPQFLNGQSMHTDWFGAWDYQIMRTWMVNCNGVTIGRRVGVAHSCNDTQYGDGTKGIVGGKAPDDTRSPQVDLATRWVSQGVDRYLSMPDKEEGKTLHMHHNAKVSPPIVPYNNRPDSGDDD